MSAPAAQQACADWIRDVVVGRKLCPWAAAPLAAGLVHLRTAEARPDALLHAVVDEAQALLHDPPEASRLVVLAPGDWAPDFDELLDLQAAAEQLLDQLDLAEDVLLVSFHPRFHYAEAHPEDPACRSNQSPHPMIHLLQRDDMDRVAADGARVANRNAAMWEAEAAAAQAGDGPGYAGGRAPEEDP